MPHGGAFDRRTRILTSTGVTAASAAEASRTRGAPPPALCVDSGSSSLGLGQESSISFSELEIILHLDRGQLLAQQLLAPLQGLREAEILLQLPLQGLGASIPRGLGAN